jgi:hypothetical protein
MSIFVFIVLLLVLIFNAFIWGNKSEEEIEKIEDSEEVETGLLVQQQQMQRQMPSNNDQLTLLQRAAVLLQNTQQMRMLVQQQNPQRKRKKKIIKKQIPEKAEKQINNKFDFMGKTNE